MVKILRPQLSIFIFPEIPNKNHEMNEKYLDKVKNSG